jgi:hypothetical protein
MRRPQVSETERFWAKVEKTDTCWIWRGTLGRGGYGTFHSAARRAAGEPSGVRAHRWSYEHVKGAIPEGLTIDHLCFVKLCVNPDHLEAVTSVENVRRYYRTITECPQGHPYTEANTLLKYGKRECRECSMARARKRRAERAALKATGACLCAAYPSGWRDCPVHRHLRKASA